MEEVELLRSGPCSPRFFGNKFHNAIKSSAFVLVDTRWLITCWAKKDLHIFCSDVRQLFIEVSNC